VNFKEFISNKLKRLQAMKLMMRREMGYSINNTSMY